MDKTQQPPFYQHQQQDATLSSNTGHTQQLNTHVMAKMLKETKDLRHVAAYDRSVDLPERLHKLD